MWNWLRIVGFQALVYATMAYDKCMETWYWLRDWYFAVPELSPHRQYFLSTTHEFNNSYLRVPPGCVYIEEWVKRGEKKCVVRYENDIIPGAWIRTPFDQHARCPWIWVGDRATEIDLTRTFNKFLVPGNRITLELVDKLIQINDRTDLVYIETGTFKELKFPGEGLLIKANADE